MGTVMSGGTVVGTASSRDRARGLEAVLLRASVDRRFRRRLLGEREHALGECELAPAERMVLESATPEQLDAMVEAVAPHVIDRRRWFERAALWFGVFLGAGALATGCSSCQVVPVAGGARPESEPPAE